MAVGGIGIERHVAEDADLRHRLLDGADGAADEIVGVERFRAGLVALFQVGMGEKRDAGDGELGRPLGGAHRLVDRKALHVGHRVDRGADLGPVEEEQRPD